MAKEITTGLNDVESKVADMICELNDWGTPGAIKRKFGRNLTKGEVTFAQKLLETVVPRTKWMKVWNAENEGARAKLRRVA